MDIRAYHIQSYIGNQKIHQLIGHSNWTYAKILLRPLVVVFLLYTSRYTMPAGWQIRRLQWIWGIIGLITYLYGLYNLIDQYLDALVVTNSGLILYQWNGLWNRKLINLQRISIESIDEEKNSFLDMFFDEGNVNISVEDKSYNFSNVQNSSQVVQDLLERKSEFVYRHIPNQIGENEVIPSGDKFDILVETLSEVIQDYMERKPKSDIY